MGKIIELNVCAPWCTELHLPEDLEFAGRVCSTSVPGSDVRVWIGQVLRDGSGATIEVSEGRDLTPEQAEALAGVLLRAARIARGDE
ncbi:MAG: hypothetical protein ACXVW0_01865 [Nocardioides sp.]